VRAGIGRALALGAAGVALAAAAPAPPADLVGPPLPPYEDRWGVVTFLGREVRPGEKTQTFVWAGESFAGTSIETPALIVRGDRPGPTLCLTAGIHGDELIGIEIARQAFVATDSRGLGGMVIALPVVNLHGFRRSSRYLPDRRDLNRFFPGHPSGSTASRIAHTVFEGVIRYCDMVVDFHTGSFHRTNLPQIRVDLTRPDLLEVALGFGAGIVVHSVGPVGTLRRAATEIGVPALTYEAGEPMRFRHHEIAAGVDGVRRLMAHLGMRDEAAAPPAGPQHVYRRSRWIRVDEGGIFLTDRALGEVIAEGDFLGTVTDPISNERSELYAPFGGRIIGMAFSQVVIPGFAAFHVGVDGEPGLEEPDLEEPGDEPGGIADEPETDLDEDERPE